MQMGKKLSRGGYRSRNGPRRKRKVKRKREGVVGPGWIMCYASGREASGESSSGFRAWRRPYWDIIPAEGRMYVRVCEVVRASPLTAVCRIRQLGEMKAVDCSIARKR